MPHKNYPVKNAPEIPGGFTLLSDVSKRLPTIKRVRAKTQVVLNVESLRILGSPDHIRFATRKISEDRAIILMIPCRKDDDGARKVNGAITSVPVDLCAYIPIGKPIEAQQFGDSPIISIWVSPNKAYPVTHVGSKTPRPVKPFPENPESPPADDGVITLSSEMTEEQAREASIRLLRRLKMDAMANALERPTTTRQALRTKTATTMHG